ncbi:MAG: Pr6Pr family membrane protein [Rhizobiaceae bacterium]
MLQIVGLALGIAALLLQFAITVPSAMEAGRSLPGAIVFYFSFFTILTNLAAVVVHAAGVFDASLSVFARPRIRAGVVVSMVVVFMVYATVLARLWQPEGLFLVCDILLHYVTPAIMLLWWLVAGRDGTTRFADIPSWLAYPILYAAYVFARAPIAGEVPYPFLNLATNGIGGVALSVLLMTGLFAVVSATVVLADRLLSAKRA